MGTSPTYNLMVNILGSFAEFEREMIADRTRRGRRHKVEVRKKYLGSNTAYGYRYIPMDRVAGSDGILQVDPQEAGVVRQMFEWVDREGLSARRVTNRLSDLRIPPRKGAQRWGKSSVLRILHYETYAGVWHYNKAQCCEPRNPAASPRYRRRAKCSVRRRPKSEWLPLELPKPLRIVPRDCWERVQRQLERNFAFSPRNEKHIYLLKGLVRCGGCGGRYVGDPCHGTFYYRCIARCKKLPSITEHLLNDAIKNAVKKIILDPSTILEPLRKLDEAEQRDSKQRQNTSHQIESEAKRLDIEEQRLLDAYRTNIISPAQLGQQLESLKSRRATLELERSALKDRDSIPAEQIEKAVVDYCADAARRISNLSDDKWQELLRTIIENITFCGDHISIRGRIPIHGGAPTAGAALKMSVPLAKKR
jgi:site-specific DNA recombinase